MRILLSLVIAGPMFGLIIMGLVNFFRISRAAQIPYVWPSDAFRIYKYAFTTMRGSRETRNMLIGFVGGILWVVVSTVLVSLIAGAKI